MNLNIQSVKVEAKLRKLKTTFTREMIQDIQSFQAMDSTLEVYIKRELRNQKFKKILSKI